MSTINSISSASNAWQTTSTSGTRGGHRADRMFAKTDTDGNGSVDTSELQGLLDNIAQKTGTTAADATDVMKKLDTNGDGSLSKSELKEGMKSLMPAPSSTLDFAQQMGGMPPPPDVSASASTATNSSSTSTSGTTSTSASTDPLDTNGDGVVSPEERAAGELKTALTDLFSAVDTNGDKSISGSEAANFRHKLHAAVEDAVQGFQSGTGDSSTAVASTSASTASSGSSPSSSDSSGSSDSSSNDAGKLTLSSFVDLVLKQYAQTASTNVQTGTDAALSVTA